MTQRFSDLDQKHTGISDCLSKMRFLGPTSAGLDGAQGCFFLEEVSWVGLRLRLVSELCSPMSSSLDGLIFFSGQRFPCESSGHGILDKQNS